MALSDRHTPELDGIRAFACLFVLAAHCITGPAIPWNTATSILYMKTVHILLGGVDLFFVLSGFLIGGILLDRKNGPNYFKVFWIRRAARILPVAYILLASYVIALGVSQAYDIKWMNITLLAEPRPPVWSFATFTQSFFLAQAGYGGPLWMGITWSLAIEEQFYILFPIAAYLLARRSVWALALAGICVAPIFRFIFEIAFGNWYAPYVLMPSRCDALMFGVLAALIVRDERILDIAKRWRYVLDAITILLVIQISVDGRLMHIWEELPGGRFPPLKQSFLALMFALIILRIFLYEKSSISAMLRSSTLGKIGAISYALYMYHQAVNGMIHGYFFNSAPSITSFAQLFAAVCVVTITFILAAISYRYLEMPIRRHAQDFTRRLKENSLIQNAGAAQESAAK